MKHFLSESATWQTISEFVTPDGKISHAKGESMISVSDMEIKNKSWAQLNGIKRTNDYKIISISPLEYIYESLNPELGKQIGKFNIDRNTLFSKFKIEGTTINGYEVIRREKDVCYAQGALYDDDSLINTWTATMYRK